MSARHSFAANSLPFSGDYSYHKAVTRCWGPAWPTFSSVIRESAEAVVEQLAKVLEAHGWKVWWDAALVGGESFRKEIDRELAQARCVVAIWCELSINF